MRRLCLDCWNCGGRKVPVTIVGDGHCDDCRDDDAQAASEQLAASYYQGGGLWAEREREAAARRTKR
jgi:hypothetical protein